MAIDRTAYNALVDDDGSGTTGTIWNKTQIASVLLNPIDAEIARVEGTWTPVIGGSGGQSGQSYAVQAGLYVKVGRLVLATFRVQLSVKGTITGSVQLKGLPFAAHATFGTATPIGWSALAVAKVNVLAEVAGTYTVADLFGIAAAATSVYTSLTATDIDNSSLFRGQLVYQAAS